ncbi:MAG: protein kinase, partial [Chloroflexi bacterium]
IRGVMMTEISGMLDDQECRLYVIGSGENEKLVSTVSLLNLERLALVVVAVLFLVVVAITVIMLL